MFALSATTRRIAVGLALCSGLAAVPAIAQPGPGGHGGDYLIRAITAFKAQLNLNTSQQAMWDNAVAASKSARDAAAQRRLSVKQVATEELAKAEPDLARIAATADQVRDAGVAAHRQIRDQWLALYATFTPEQKAVVKSAIEKRIARMDSFREKMRQRFSTG